MGDWQDLLAPAGQIVAAAVLGALVGLERERGEHPAGLRTHMLVCVGAALFTLVSREVAGTRFDPGRIAAQIVSGIGFLGAGTILRQGTIIRGLTTAASLWVVAGLGMAVASGGRMAWLALFATCLVVFTLAVLHRLEFLGASRSGVHALSISLVSDREGVGRFLLGLAEQGIELRRVGIDAEEGGGRFQLRLQMRTPPGVSPRTLGPWIGSQSGVSDVAWE